MAITTGSKIEVALRATAAGTVLMNVWQYHVLEIVGTPTAAHYGEAWWNHVKAGYRALALTAWGQVFTSVRVTEIGNPAGEYGEFPVPTGEKTGTRTNPTDAESMPNLVAVGVRLSVGTRATRPGQKRFSFLTQSDVIGEDVQPAYQALLVTLMDTMTANMTLGSPAAGVVLVPNIVGLNPDGTVREAQFVTGYAINGKVSSQVSRKHGRGI